MSKIFSTAYFPPISYCSKLRDCDKLIFDIGEHFVKQSQRNRTYILGPNGILKLIVPLKKWKNNTPVKHIEICYEENWQKIHWKSLEASYRSSPYFEYYEDQLAELILKSNFKYLYELNWQCLHFVFEKLNINSIIKESLEFQEEVKKENDFRQIPFAAGDESNSYKEYNQVFNNSPFVSNLSFLDLICNEGPNSIYKL